MAGVRASLRSSEDPPRLLETLPGILSVDLETVFCARRGLLPDDRAAPERKLDFLRSLCQRVEHLRGGGPEAREIIRPLLGREDPTAWITGFHYSKRNLIEGCLATIGSGASVGP